jgi:hypothetical protein
LFRQLAVENEGPKLLGTHSSSLQALLMGFMVQAHTLSKVAPLRSHRENQECIVGIDADELGLFTSYSAFMGSINSVPEMSSDLEKKRHTLKFDLSTPAGNTLAIALQIRQRMIGSTIQTFEKRGYRLHDVRMVA